MVRRILLACVVVQVLALGVAGAHTAVRDADPAPGESVTGVVDRVVLEFLDPVVPTPEILVHGPDGEPVPGLEPVILRADDEVAERRFAPLVTPGRYRVDYAYHSLDGSAQAGAHQFRFTPSGDTSTPTGGRIAAGAFAAVAAASVVLAARRARRSTR